MTPVSAADVAAAARATLAAHLPAQLAALPRPLPEPTSYNEVPTLEAIRFVKRSVLAVSVPALRREPQRYGDGSYDAEFVLSVAVWHEQAADLPLLTAAADYAAAVRATVLRHQDLGGLATQTAWAGETVDLVGDAQTALTLGLGICEFTVLVPAVVDEQPLPPGGAGTGPVVLTTDVQHIVTNP